MGGGPSADPPPPLYWQEHALFASWRVPLGPHGGFVHGDPVWQAPPTQLPFWQWSHVAYTGHASRAVVP